MLPLIRTGKIKGLAHITGGGITENTPRMLPDGLVPKIDRAAWELPPVFSWMKDVGAIEDAEMMRTFNCGVGMIVSVAPDDVMDVLAGLTEAGEAAFVVGEVQSA
jgi:phosphoribosylformylglycinamidine cyclo-ligase